MDHDPLPAVQSAKRSVGLVLFVFVAACGGGAEESSSRSVILTANSTSIVSGQLTTLSWSSPEGSSCVAMGAWSGTLPSIGSKAVTPPSNVISSEYGITCMVNGSEESAAVLVQTINAVPFEASISVFPGVVLLGQPVILNWASTGFSECTVTGLGMHFSGLNGSALSTPFQQGTFTYTLSCAGSGQFRTAQASAVVLAGSD